MRYLSLLATIIIPLGLYAFIFNSSVFSSSFLSEHLNDDKTAFIATLPEDTSNRELLIQSWKSYRKTFIQNEGRVID